MELINENFLKPTYFVDSDSKIVQSKATNLTTKAMTDAEKAIELFYYTRDEILYDPYDSLVSRKARYKASKTITEKKGWCIQKAVVLAALARAVGIPSRLHFADIQNHQTPEKLKKRNGNDVFIYHGYTDLFLNGKWIKATPAFNKSLCDKFGFKTVEFNGINDGILPSTTINGERYVEYLKDRGTDYDLPYKKMWITMINYYSNLK